MRGQRVYARANEAGALRVEGGRVEIRYQPADGRRYQARVDNLTVVPGPVLPDETCGPAGDVERAVKTSAAEGAAPAAPAAAAKGKRRVAPADRATDGHSEADASSAVIAYADGACSGNPGPCGLGVVIIDGARRIELSEYLGIGTNNVAELTAVLRVLEEVPADSRLLVHTDSQYTIGVVQKGWKAKANVELVASLRAAFKGRHATRLVYVPGHSGVALNERVDELARDAVRTRSTHRAEPKTSSPKAPDETGA